MNSDLFFPHFPQIPSASTQSLLNHKFLGIKPPNAGSVFGGHPFIAINVVHTLYLLQDQVFLVPGDSLPNSVAYSSFDWRFHSQAFCRIRWFLG
jgi:hypothetical protein